jgi:hypothetical protein
VALGVDGVEHSGAEGERLAYLRIGSQKGAAAIA